MLAGLILFLAAMVFAWWLLTPRVMAVSPVDRAQDVFPSSPIVVEFNTHLAEQDVASLLSITPDVPYKTSIEENTLTIMPVNPFAQGETISVTVGRGIKSSLGLPSSTSTTWSFRIKNPWLLYLLDGETKTDLYLIDPAGLITGKVFEIAESIVDYSITPDGSGIVYTAQKGNDTLISWYDLQEGIHHPLYTCRGMVCSQPTLSADFRYLAFTSGLSIKEGGTGSGKVWLLTLNQKEAFGEPIPASGNNHPTRDPAWSATGWLALYDDADAVFLFFQPSTGKRTSMANGTGEPGSWNKPGDAYLVPEIQYVDPATNGGVEYYSRLVELNPVTGAKTDLTQNNQAEDLLPQYSPSGTKVVFARRFLNAKDWTPGRQVWVVNSDGSNPRNFTASPDFNHLGFAWSPDDHTLAYLRFNTASLNLQREMWVMDTQTGLSQKVLMDAYRLEWLP